MSANVGPLFLVTPEQISGNIVNWLKNNSAWLQEKLHHQGGVLLRDFGLSSVSEFNQLALAICPNLSEYIYQSTPRTRIGGKIYSSTEYPQDKTIALHSENAYSNHWPRIIMFYSALVAESGGQTPIADNRHIYANMPQKIRARFEQKGVLYVRNYHPGIDLSWQQVFQTTHKEAVESYCHNNNIRYEWRGENSLHTQQVCPGVLAHPITKEKVWFNQAHLFHISSLSAQEQKLLREEFSETDLPRNTYFGDGTPMDEAELELIRDLYLQEKNIFDWQQGDVMVLDNVQMSHGREPYTGDRKVVVAMA